jgi:hypothetical protein
MPPVDDSVGRYRQRMADIERTMAFDEKVGEAKREEQREEQRQQAATRKRDGDAAYRASDIPRALALYSEAIELDFAVGNDEQFTAVRPCPRPRPRSPRTDVSPLTSAPATLLPQVLYANRSAARAREAEAGRVEAWAEVEHDCRRALQRHETAKCWLRCARACEKLGQPSRACRASTAPRAAPRTAPHHERA